MGFTFVIPGLNCPSMKTTDDYIMIGICSMLHMLVDGLCMCGCFLMSQMIGYDSIIIALIVYNVTAFLTQPFTGILADRLHHRHWLLLTSCLLLSLASLGVFVMAFLTSLWTMIVVAILLGLGNSCFHVWGGKQTAVTTGNDMRALGVFVSTGAFGRSVASSNFRTVPKKSGPSIS